MGAAWGEGGGAVDVMAGVGAGVGPVGSAVGGVIFLRRISRNTTTAIVAMAPMVIGRRQVPDGTWLRREVAVMVTLRGGGAWVKVLGILPSKGMTPDREVSLGS